MEVRQYRIFKEVAETGSFTKAAANLYITQSAVSHAVRDLEERAGTVLFDRLSKSIRITAVSYTHLDVYKRQSLQRGSIIAAGICFLSLSAWG